MTAARASVLGYGAVAALGDDVSAVVEALVAGRSGLVPSRYATARVEGRCALEGDPLPAGEPRALSLLRHATLAALADGGVEPASLRGRADVALVVGTSSGAMDQAERLFDGDLGAALGFGATYDAQTLALARELGLRGAVETVGAACASGAMAIARAARLVASGQVALALAGGTDALTRFVHVGFDALGALSATGPRPFRLGRDGLALGEGAAMVVLAPAGAPARRGRVLGAGASCDARHVTAPDRDGLGLADAIMRATRDADLDASALAPFVVQVHGTATVFNDAMEARALERALGPAGRTAPAFGAKQALGHTLGASGALEAVLALACLARGVVPPTPGLGELDPDCTLGIADSARSCDARLALKLAAAFGGMNCALWLGAPELAP